MGAVAASPGPGLAPADGRAFAERLVGALLHGQPGSSGDALDMAAAAEVYGAFADAFLRHDWKGSPAFAWGAASSSGRRPRSSERDGQRRWAVE